MRKSLLITMINVSWWIVKRKSSFLSHHHHHQKKKKKTTLFSRWIICLFVFRHWKIKQRSIRNFLFRSNECPPVSFFFCSSTIKCSFFYSRSLLFFPSLTLIVPRVIQDFLSSSLRIDRRDSPCQKSISIKQKQISFAIEFAEINSIRSLIFLPILIIFCARMTTVKKNVSRSFQSIHVYADTFLHLDLSIPSSSFSSSMWKWLSFEYEKDRSVRKI